MPHTVPAPRTAKSLICLLPVLMVTVALLTPSRTMARSRADVPQPAPQAAPTTPDPLIVVGLEVLYYRTAEGGQNAGSAAAVV